MKITIYLLLVATVFSFSRCSKDDEPLVANQRGSWSRGWPKLFHDGAPFESENFIVFSDKSSQEWREDVAEQAEASFVNIKSNLSIEDADLDFVASQSNRKIHILTNYDQWNIAVAYRDGMIIRSKDGPNFFGDHNTWLKVFEHEMTHVFEFLLIGNPTNSGASFVWMREGFGNYGARNHKIKNTFELEAWKSKMKNVKGEGNPIDIHVWGDFPQSVTSAGTTGEYYAFFELAVRYLLDDENGNGTSIDNLKAYFEDLGIGVSRNAAFKKHFGLTAQEFQDNYWDLMTAYLQE